MALLRPIGKSTKLAFFKKETTEGTYVAPTQEIPFKTCDIKKVMKTEEDTSNIGEVFTSDLITMGYDVTGNVEMNVYPETVGSLLFYSLGKDGTPANPITSILVIRYVGTANTRTRITLASSVFSAEKWNGSAWEADTNFGTAGSYDPTTDTVAEMATTIGAYTGYDAYYIGLSTDTISNIADFAATTIQNETDRVSLLCKGLTASTVAKSHYIYSSNAVADGIPAFSGLVDKGFGSGQAFGYTGLKINTLSLSFAVKTILTASLSVRAKDEETGKTDTSTDFTPMNPYVTNKAKIYIDGYEFEDIRDLTLEINNNMYMDEAISNNTYNSQDRQGAVINVSGTCNLTVESGNNQATYTLNDKFVNNTAVDMVIVLEHDSECDTDIPYLAVIYLPKIKLSDGTTTIGGAERLQLSFAGQTVKNSLIGHILTYVNNTQTGAY